VSGVVPGVVKGTSPYEIHRYPLRPRGFEEPLFPSAASRREIGAHLLRASWLKRASELTPDAGESAHGFREAVEIRVSGPGQVEVVRSGRRGRCSWRRRRVLRRLGWWREVAGWWDEERAADRMVFRVLLGGGAVVDLARERAGGWFLVGMPD